MLQFIMDHNVLLYVLAAACVVGAASQIILRQIYDRLIRDTENTGQPSGRFLQQLRQRFQYCTHLNEKVGDVQALIRRSLLDYRFWGMSLHQWKRMGMQCLVISLLCAAIGCANYMQSGRELLTGSTYFWMGLLAVALTAAAYGISDTAYRREALEIGLTDYLQNSGAVRDYSESEPETDGYEPEYGAMDSVTPIHAVAESRKAKRRARAETAAAETRAQREKRELKENLSRVKAGMQETAAGQERERSGSSELLRQLDPKDQERIVREVLQKFLS